jgi:hypothetical protein
MGPSAVERRWDILRYCDGSEIWTLNNAYHTFGHVLPCVSRWFELHSWEYLKTWPSGSPDHFKSLDALNIPVYVSEPLPVIRRQVLVDWVKVFSHFVGARPSGMGDRPVAPTGFAMNYFLGSPSLMLALALYEHDIGLAPLERVQSWGIDTSDPQHKQQRQSWAYWISQCHARGIENGGTATDFMTEAESDGGLTGLRERIGDEIERCTGKRQLAPKKGGTP